MLIWLLVLFAALSPGVLFTMPSLGKKLGGKVVIAAMHAVLFVIVVRLLRVRTEGFQMFGKTPPSKVTNKASTQQLLDNSIRNLNDIKKELSLAREAVQDVETRYTGANKQVAIFTEQLAKEQSAAATKPVATPIQGPKVGPQNVYKKVPVKSKPTNAAEAAAMQAIIDNE